MISMPQQTAPTQDLPTVSATPRVSGVWDLAPAGASDADLAAILAAALHRGLVPTPPRKSLPIQVSF